jgi:hypothetical protein
MLGSREFKVDTRFLHSALEREGGLIVEPWQYFHQVLVIGYSHYLPYLVLGAAGHKPKCVAAPKP